MKLIDKYIICLLLSFISWDALHAQQSTYQKGDSIWLTSNDTSDVKVFKLKFNTVHPRGNGGGGIDLVDNLFYTRMVTAQKYDTIGPLLNLVSDTAHDHWNPVSAMWIYEVVSKTKSLDPSHYFLKHEAWLDSKKKILSLKIWPFLEFTTGECFSTEVSPFINLPKTND